MSSLLIRARSTRVVGMWFNVHACITGLLEQKESSMCIRRSRNTPFLSFVVSSSVVDGDLELMSR